MTAEKPEGDVARFGEDVETIVQRLRDFADDGSICMHDASDAADMLESQATRIETLTEAINAFLAKYDELEPVVLGMTVRCYGPDGYKGKTWGVELAALRALSAGQGEAK